MGTERHPAGGQDGRFFGPYAGPQQPPPPASTGAPAPAGVPASAAPAERTVRCHECRKFVPESQVVYVNRNLGDMDDPCDDFQPAQAYPICMKCTNSDGLTLRVVLAIVTALGVTVGLWLYSVCR